VTVNAAWRPGWWRLRGPRAETLAVLPGLAVAALAFALHPLAPILPTLTAAFIFGLAFGQLPGRVSRAGTLLPGFAFASRTLLRIGIFLLGLEVTLHDILDVGWQTVVLVAVLVAASFAVTFGVFRLVGVDRTTSVLVAAGFSICGVSAVGATSAAIRARDEDSVVPIALVTLFGTSAIVLLPLTNTLLQLDPQPFGAWVGASVHDVGQVVATAQSAGASALAIAVTIKLVRVVMLAPMIAIVGAVEHRREEHSSKRPAIVPSFVVAFIVVAVINSLVPIPDFVRTGAHIAQNVLFGVALFSIGASIRLRRLFVTGARCVLAGAISWAIIAAMALAVVESMWP
jgi:uncharacterized integral membrane protein (TIGR00698 family)